MTDWRAIVKKPWFVPASLAALLAVAVLRFGTSSLLIAGGLAIGLLIVWLYFRWREGRQADQFRAGLNQNAGKAPSGVNDPSRRVELDRLRQKFNEGLKRVLDEGRRKGVDFLYRHPWIMVVGEPGSGKTEAIRHSGIVSARNQDELQGAGGTLNMDWWFTDRAVILDTAGRMVFEEAAGTSNNEFKEFLRLLCKGRPLTPINGLLVTVSADTLVAGTEDQIRERSTTLAEKIAQIQTTLEVRFPVYVVVTKCDKITGFREFFEGMDDPAQVNQILGWSNPDSLDVPFKADRVEQHLSEAIDTLRLLRYRLLDRPSGPSNLNRRTDEVDSLFAFPHSLQTLAARLKMYLEPVFATGEWSSGAPLFVRGVYFSSALCQGAVLDQELAAALGVSVDKLGDEGKVFRRDRALFLRDLFVEKIMPERGLVTSSHRTEGIVFRRRLIVWGTGGSFALCLVGVLWWANWTLSKDVAHEVGLLSAAKANRTSAGFVPTIARTGPGGAWTYTGEKTLRVNEALISLEEFQRQLEISTRQPLHVPWMFRLAAVFRSDANQLRRQAQNAIVTADLVLPVIEATRDRIVRDNAWSDEHTAALSRLVQIESSFHGGVPMPATADGFLKPFWDFGLKSTKPAKDLETVFESTFSLVHGVQPAWLPPRASGGSSLAENKPIAAGIAKLAQSQEQRMKNVVAGLDAFRELQAALTTLRRIEDELIAVSRTGDAARLQAWADAIRRYRLQRNAVDQLVAKATARGMFRGDVVLMSEAIATMNEEFQASFEGFRKAVMERAASTSTTTESSRSFPLPEEIAGQIRKLGEDASKQVTGAFSERDLEEIRALDRRFLVRDASGTAAYVARVALLEKLLEVLKGEKDSSELRLIGHLSEYERMIASAESDRTGLLPVNSVPPAPLSAAPANATPAPKAPAATTPVSTGATPAAVTPPTPVAAPGAATKDPVTMAARELLMDLYEAEFDWFLDENVGFPIVIDRVEHPVKPRTLPALRDTLARLRDDFGTFEALSLSPTSRPAQVRARVDRVLRLVEPIVFALVNPEGRFSRVGLTHPGAEEQRKAVVREGGYDNVNNRIAGFYWREVVSNGKRFTSNDTVDLGDFPVISDELQLEFYRYGENEPPDGPPLLPLKDWQLFRSMLLRPSFRKEDGREWQVMFLRKHGLSGERAMAMVLRFPQAFPAVRDWPTWSQIKDRGRSRR